MRPGIRFLADNRALSDVPPNRKFAGAGPRRRSAGVFPTGARVAVLVSNTFQYGTTRQFSVLSVEAGAAVEPFYDVDDALRWLSATEQRMKRRPRRR